MGLEFEYIEGQTPIDEDEREGLLIPTIATQGELNEYEQKNIEEAVQWTIGGKFAQKKIFTEAFVKNVHKRMYGNIWNWAGDFRRSNKNIGVDKTEIAVTLLNLLNDATYWIENKTYQPDEIAIRFKHRIVSIHCFPNGNGRHSRLMADIIIEKIYNHPIFSWGSSNLINEGRSRITYIQALKDADRGDYRSLLVFARS